jgi:hypothetical protein
MPITSSESSFSVIQRTQLPIGRVLVSSKRTNFPDLTARIIWLSPLIWFNNSSPSLIVIAAPLTLGLEYFSRCFLYLTF